MDESTRKRIYQIEIALAVVLLLVSVISLFPGRGITGYVSVDTKTKALNLTIANSQSYILTTNNEKTFYLTSLKISGEVKGNGRTEIFIDNGKGQRILIFSNIVKKGAGFTGITGMGKISGKFTGASSETDKEEENLVIEYLENIETKLFGLEEDEELANGKFEDKCIESCFIEMLLNKDIGYQLLFYVEDGIILDLNELSYTVRKDWNGKNYWHHKYKRRQRENKFSLVSF